MRLIDFDTDHIYIIFMCIYIYIHIYIYICVFFLRVLEDKKLRFGFVHSVGFRITVSLHFLFVLSYYLFSLLIFLGIMTYCFFNCARTGRMEKYQGSMTYNSDT